MRCRGDFDQRDDAQVSLAGTAAAVELYQQGLHRDEELPIHSRELLKLHRHFLLGELIDGKDGALDALLDALLDHSAFSINELAEEAGEALWGRLRRREGRGLNGG